MTPFEALQPLIDDINRKSALKIKLHDPSCAVLNRGGACDCVAQIPHNVDPPIARAEHLQNMIRGLLRDRDMYRKLLEDTEKTLAEYEVMAGNVPF